MTSATCGDRALPSLRDYRLGSLDYPAMNRRAIFIRPSGTPSKSTMLSQGPAEWERIPPMAETQTMIAIGSEKETRLGGQGRTPVKRDRERIHRKDGTK